MLFKDYKNAFRDKSIWLFGKGPTNFNYEDIRGIQTPIFAINESVLVAEEYRPKYPEITLHFSHDSSTKKAVRRNDNYTSILPKWDLSSDNISEKYHIDFIDDNGEYIRDYCIMYNTSKSKIRPSNFLPIFHEETCNVIGTDVDRTLMANEEWLPTLVGTIRTVVAFAFYSGVNHINLVGCDGLQKEDSLQRFGHQYDKRLHKYISSKSYGSHWKHRARAEVMMNNCGITYEFVGTP